MNIQTITGPAHWASYLVNGDASGLDANEFAMADAWLRDNACTVLSTTEDEPRFTWHYRLYNPLADCSGGSVVDYICDVKP